MDLQAWVTAGLSLLGAILTAVIIGRLFAPKLEARKVATVAASEEMATFAQHLHLLAVDLRMAKTYEALALHDTDVEANIGKVFGMLDEVSKRGNEAATIARAGERASFSEKEREAASLVIGIVLKFAGQQYGFIRKGQAYFQRLGETEDNYLDDMANLLDFASKVFHPHRFVWFPLRRLHKKMEAFIASVLDDLQQAHMAELHELGLRLQGEGDGQRDGQGPSSG